MSAYRSRRTRGEIEEIKEAIYYIARDDQPVTIRQLFYRLVSEGLIDKTVASGEVYGFATCPEGKAPLGGGWYNATNGPGSQPWGNFSDPSAGPAGWEVSGDYGQAVITQDGIVFADCASITP